MKIKEVRHLLTYGCNLRCQHCYLSAGEVGDNKPADLSQEEVDRFYHYFKPDVVSATGGEPLLRIEMVYKLAKSLAAYGGALEIVTNGFMLTKGIADELKKLNKKTFFQISLDGTKDYHNKIRKSPLAYDNAMDAIKLVAGKGFVTKVRLTATNENVKQIPKVIEALSSLGNENIRLVIRPVVAKGRAKANDLKLDIDYKELESLKELSEVIIVETTDNEGKCGCGTDTIAIDPFGGIYPCTYFVFDENYKMGNIWDLPSKLTENEEFAGFKGACYARQAV
ncbi:MAG: radical SAM protein [bacterium]|nr:radical SAM protein [bacterium]